MNVSFRVDSSTQIGSGHVMRCMTLADRLKDDGHAVFFISRDLPGNLCNVIEGRGYKIFRLPYDVLHRHTAAVIEGYVGWLGVEWHIDAEEVISLCRKSVSCDWLIMDHYALDYQWEKAVRSGTNKVMVIDDLANRIHDCDILLDQNYYADMDSRYRTLVPRECRVLVGPRYALIRSEFILARRSGRERDGSITSILIFFGGSDLTNETEKALDAIRALNRPDITVDVVVGASNPHRVRIEAICSTMTKVNYFCQVENMAELMTRADLSVGAGGSTTWERCCLGLPCLVVSVAENQVKIAEAAHRYGAIHYLGHHDTVTVDDIYHGLRYLLLARDRMRRMSSLANMLVDGRGAELVVQALKQA